MDLKLALVILPVGDVDRAKAFYVEQMCFSEDYDMAPNEQFRIAQLTPPGSACSIAIGRGLTDPEPEPGSVKGLRIIVDDIEQACDELSQRGCTVSGIDDRPWVGSRGSATRTGTKVTNYVQWESVNDFEAMLENPEAVPHMREAARIAEKYERNLYEVSFVDEVSDDAGHSG